MFHLDCFGHREDGPVVMERKIYAKGFKPRHQIIRRGRQIRPIRIRYLLRCVCHTQRYGEKAELLQALRQKFEEEPPFVA